ncbi:F-box/LRR-repeat protein 17-like [Bacillus rossius redtenbacheri]|uniref:F-box/LRR-repeat protein 17-like n=1 Tax=Bacillus rossius redtenbacheri TaxID=93214 RepID=UPI002FDE60D6
MTGAWGDVPDELLLEIFSYLDVEDLVCRAQRVCSRWREVSSDTRLWTSLEYCPSPGVCCEEVRSFLLQVPQLRRFRLCAHDQVDTIVEMLPDYCPNIDTLRLQYSRRACSHEGLLAKLLFCLENIRCLEISLVEIDDELLGTFWLAQNLQSLSLKLTTCDWKLHRLLSHVTHNCISLKELRISVQNDMFDSDLKGLVQKVNKLLTHFSYASGDGFNQDTSNIFYQCTNMKSLAINRSTFYAGIENLELIGKLPQLENLAIFCMNVAPDSLAQLFLDNSWNKLVKLDFVGLKGFDNSSLEHVFRACPNLQELNLCDSSISDEGFQPVCNPGSRLKRLALNGTRLTDAGLQNVHRCRRLEALNVEDCPYLTGNIAIHIAKCARLTDLDVGNNAWVTGETVKTLLLCPRLERLGAEFCPNITAACFESIVLPRNFRRVRVTCADHTELENLLEVAGRKSFLSIASWCFSIPDYVS